ncbi:MAG: radical SAM protein [Promethearchaeota archaeon]|jgi:sulfatase maturation enzyme AslB (radical SAM superfamily)
MDKEWSSQWNPFNSAKALLWRKHLEGCAKNKFLPPVTVSVDPSGKCNFNCIWCNAYEYMQSCKDNIPTNHLISIAKFLHIWGVKSVCVAGGGEPLLNNATKDFLLHLHANNIDAALVTNGSLFDEDTIDIAARTCRWVGFSMDAGTNSTYMIVKNINDANIFDAVCENISKLAHKIKAFHSKCDIGFKFLLHPLNAKDIFTAANLAKSLGANDFQLRPVGWDNLLKTQNKKQLNYSDLYKLIDDEICRAMELECDSFHVYGIRHKFNRDFSRKISFSKCWAAPLAALAFCSDGNCYHCIDLRGIKKHILCQHYPDPYTIFHYWNSEEHKKQIREIIPSNCPRCTIGPYNEIIEQVILDDKMCRDFL